MRRLEHYAHDAMEIYAAAEMQRLAEVRGIAESRDSAEKYKEFVDYAAERGLTEDWFTSGPYPEFKQACDTHLPPFIDRLAETYPGQSMDFISVEREYRNAGLKGDVLIRSSGEKTSLSLKTYRGNILRPQFNSHTFRSFLLGFLFEPKVGWYVNPATGIKFKGSSVSERDQVLSDNGFEDVIPIMRALDAQNETLRAQFVYNDRFAVLDEEGEAILDEWRKRIGHEGADLAIEALTRMPDALVKDRILKMIGMDGAEELLLMDTVRASDTLTNFAFRSLRDRLLVGEVEVARRGQGIQVRLVNGGERLLAVDFPFTINTNGAWYMEETPPEGTYHSKEKRVLHFRDRRPKKSKELSTMVLTYVDLSKTGIFDEP